MSDEQYRNELINKYNFKESHLGMTLAEKILARASGKQKVVPDEIVVAKVDVAMSHENADVVRKSFIEIGVEKVWDPDKIVIIFDHRVPAESERTAITHKAVREFVKKQGIKNFYDVGKGGICHQVLPEKGHIFPGAVVVGTDSHTTTHGAFGAFSLGIGGTEMAGVWIEGELWFKVPHTIKIICEGKFKPGVYSKDLILYIIGKIKADGADYRSVEFSGSTIDEMSLSSRMVLCNLAMEMGAKVAFTPVDKKVIEFIEQRRDDKSFDHSLKPDNNAIYEKELFINVEKEIIEPQIACPHFVDNVKPLSKVGNLIIHQGVIGSCTNGRIEDLKAAAEILKGRKVADGTRLIIIPASQEIYLEALKLNYIQTFIESGAMINPSGCGPCVGVHQGILAPGEVCISSTNRNFLGRMGSKDSFVYLASPAVVAASVITGKLTNPAKLN
jgi:3-isopropylmalate/(R)-2-methylmalate dehydratase large subunit